MVSAARLLVVGATLVVTLCGGMIAGVRRLMSRPVTRADRVILALAVLVVLAAAYAFYEPYWPQVVRIAVNSPKLEPGTRPIRIVQLSDIHSGAHVRLEDDLPTIVRSLDPDIIVFTGDAVNVKAGVGPFRRLMTDLAGIAPTFAVRGNWDVWWFPRANLFGNTGVRELKAQAVPIDVRGTEIWVAGIPVDSEKATGAISRVPKQKVLVFLHHYPWAAKLAADLGADLHLAGDTHGGQMRIPFLGELVRLTRHGAWYPAGLRRERGTWSYVNRGIGMEGSFPPVRFLCRPEITLVELTGEE